MALRPRPTATLPPIKFSQPQQLDLNIYRGDSGRFRVTVVDDQGLPYDVSDALWDCDIRPDVDGSLVTSLTVTQVDPATIDISLSAAQSAALTGNGVWDLEMSLNGEVTTLLVGRVVVTKDVSRAAT